MQRSNNPYAAGEKLIDDDDEEDNNKGKAKLDLNSILNKARPIIEDDELVQKKAPKF